MLGSFFVEIEATDGTVGFATGFGGVPACWIAHNHFERFLIGAGMSCGTHVASPHQLYGSLKLVVFACRLMDSS